MPYYQSFTDKFSFQERLNESTRVITKFPDRIPIICEKNNLDLATPDIDKHKYLVPREITIGQFIQVIRKRISALPASDAIFLFIGDNIFSNNTAISSIYEENKNKDGFLYITYSRESTFGK
jgi:GABA(A) receptor-associated protein